MAHPNSVSLNILQNAGRGAFSMEDWIFQQLRELTVEDKEDAKLFSANDIRSAIDIVTTDMGFDEPTRARLADVIVAVAVSDLNR